MEAEQAVRLLYLMYRLVQYSQKREGSYTGEAALQGHLPNEDEEHVRSGPIYKKWRFRHGVVSMSRVRPET